MKRPKNTTQNGLTIRGENSTLLRKEENNQLKLDFTISAKVRSIEEIRKIPLKEREAHTGERASIDKILRHPNVLMSSRFEFSVVERRVFLLVLKEMKGMQLLVDIEPLPSHEITFRIHYSQIVDRNVNSSFTKGIENIHTKDVHWLDSRGKLVKETMFIASSYEEGYVNLVLNYRLIPLFLDLSKGYTDYMIDHVLMLTSEYSQILYPEFCRALAFRSELKLSLDQLRKLLYIKDDQYREFKVFRRSVIEVAINQINNLTDISVNYECVKAGRTVIGLLFTIKREDKSVAGKDREAVRESIRDKVQQTFEQLDEFTAMRKATEVLAQSYPTFTSEQKKQIISNQDLLSRFIRSDLYALHDPYISDRQAYVAESVFGYKKNKKRRSQD